jgi:transcriptional regulator with XRE-family HTH domain
MSIDIYKLFRIFCEEIMSLSENIRKLCKNKNISINALEKEIGFGGSTISKWEKSSPTVDKLQKVADYFGVTTDYLLGKESPTPPTGDKCNDAPLDPETVEILCQIPLLSKNNKAIILDMIQSMLKNRE